MKHAKSTAKVCSLLLAFVAVLAVVAGRAATAEKSPSEKKPAPGFSFAVYGDSRSMMYLPGNSDQKEEATSSWLICSIWCLRFRGLRRDRRYYRAHGGRLPARRHHRRDGGELATRQGNGSRDAGQAVVPRRESRQPARRDVLQYRSSGRKSSGAKHPCRDRTGAGASPVCQAVEI